VLPFTPTLKPETTMAAPSTMRQSAGEGIPARLEVSAAGLRLLQDEHVLAQDPTAPAAPEGATQEARPLSGAMEGGAQPAVSTHLVARAMIAAALSSTTTPVSATAGEPASASQQGPGVAPGPSGAGVAVPRETIRTGAASAVVAPRVFTPPAADIESDPPPVVANLRKTAWLDLASSSKAATGRGAMRDNSERGPSPAISRPVATAGWSVSPHAAVAGAVTQPPAGGAATAAAQAPRGAQETPLAGQVVRAISLAWRDGVGEARVRLVPDHLGEVNVALRVERGQVTAELRAETPAAREWIQAHEQDLRSGLAAQGLRLDRLVVLADGQRQRQQEQSQSQPQPRRPLRGSEADDPAFDVDG
jgi:Meckel syndrome type 1 protein